MAHYKLLDAQKAFLEIPHNYQLDVALYQGGYGSGKTWAGSLLGILLSQKYAGSTGLVGAKDYELLKNTTLVDYFKHLDKLGFKCNIHYKYNKTDKIITFKNGSKILFKDIEDPEKFKSLNLHWAEVEEASQVDYSAIKQLLGRLRAEINKNWKDFKYRLFGHTNPEASKGWIYRTFVENKKPNYRLIIAPTTQNIYLPEHFVDELKKAYDPEYYRINVLGEFGDYSSGLVVKGFGNNNVRKINYQPDLDLHICCDFNVDPMSWILAHKTDEKVFFFDEIVLENTTTVRAVEEFYARYSGHKAKIIINGDASGDNRSSNSEFTNYVLMKNRLSSLGFKDIQIKIRSFNPPIKNRIAAWNSKIRNANDEIGIFIDPRCKWLIYNCENLKYKEGTSQIDLPSHYQIKNNRELKFLGHPFDAASYLVEYYWPIVLDGYHRSPNNISIPTIANFNHLLKTAEF